MFQCAHHKRPTNSTQSILTRPWPSDLQSANLPTALLFADMHASTTLLIPGEHLPDDLKETDSEPFVRHGPRHCLPSLVTTVSRRAGAEAIASLLEGHNEAGMSLHVSCTCTTA